MFIEILGWIANTLAILGWLVNIKWRLYAMMIFTVATILSIIYFAITWQLSFLVRMVIYLGIDIVTIWHIQRKELVV